MKVKLITHTPEPEKIIATAAKLCYSNSEIETLMDGLTEEKVESFVDMLASIGHESPIEHVTFTFGIEEVSRSFLAEMTRHRMASFSVQSQRYVEVTDFKFVTPPEIAADENAVKIFNEQMDSAIESYNKLAEILKAKHYKTFIAEGCDEKTAKHKAQKKAIEDARFVLPNAANTKMVVTMNARSLMNFFKLRCCNRAQWEIRSVAAEMLRLCCEVAPTLFKNAGPSCVRFGKCCEGNMTCGKMAEVQKFYGDLKNGK
ncbi:MAG: FAD-dependent thymidylate synthase [Hominimerdicola sp.]